MTPDHKTTIGAILAAILIFVGVVVTMDKFFGDNLLTQSQSASALNKNNVQEKQ